VVATQAYLGNKIRRLRKEKSLTQVQLAGMLHISASYLNLIERNQRAMTVPLLLKLAEIFHLDLRTFAEDDEAQLVADLKEAFIDPAFSGEDVRPMDAQELAMGSPNVARAVLRLYRAYRKSREDALSLASQIAPGDELYGVETVRLPMEEVSDVIQEHMNYFPDLEEAAGALAKEARLDPNEMHAALVRHLERAHDIKTEIVNANQLDGAVRRYFPRRRRLVLSEVLSPASQTFQVAHQIGLLTLDPVLDRIAESSRLSTDESRRLCRVALANYFAAAVLMPYDRFLEAAESVRYDLEILEHRFRASFEQVCHRLTSLNRTGSRGIPFHLIRIDIAGNISKRFSSSGIPFARYSGACPRWNVHAAFLTPGMIRTQLSAMPDGTMYFSIARTVRKAGGGHQVPQNRLAIELGCEAKRASAMVYADGVDLDRVEAAVPVGVTCRLCERMDCRQRAFPPMHQRLHIDENVRGLSFFATLQGPERRAPAPKISKR
jgi:predicted transcriptional regulator/transcriptional regulator with XRE-family HTH domain